MLHGSGPGATGWSNFTPNIGPLGRDVPRDRASTCPAGATPTRSPTTNATTPPPSSSCMDELGIEKAALVGNSMGGATSIRWPARNPERVSHLITMGAGAHGVQLFGAGDGPTEGLKILQAAYPTPSPRRCRGSSRSWCSTRVPPPTSCVQQRSDAPLEHPDHLANFAAGIGRPRPGVATDAGGGRRHHSADADHPRPRRPRRPLRALAASGAMIANSRLVLLNRCGHWAQIEHADEFNRLRDRLHRQQLTPRACTPRRTR